VVGGGSSGVGRQWSSSEGGWVNHRGTEAQRGGGACRQSTVGAGCARGGGAAALRHSERSEESLVCCGGAAATGRLCMQNERDASPSALHDGLGGSQSSVVSRRLAVGGGCRFAGRWRCGSRHSERSEESLFDAVALWRWGCCACRTERDASPSALHDGYVALYGERYDAARFAVLVRGSWFCARERASCGSSRTAARRHIPAA
jgi:hypothetical protein